MVYLCKKPDLRWCHGIVIREEKLELEDASYTVVSFSYGIENTSGADLHKGTETVHGSRHQNIASCPHEEQR